MKIENRPYQEIKGMPFFVEDQFYKNHEAYIKELSCQITRISDIDDDWSEECGVGEQDFVVQLDENKLSDLIFTSDEERFSEDPDSEIEKIKEVFRKCVDFGKLNSMMPKLWYGRGDGYVITKSDVYDDLVKIFEQQKIN